MAGVFVGVLLIACTEVWATESSSLQVVEAAVRKRGCWSRVTQEQVPQDEDGIGEIHESRVVDVERVLALSSHDSQEEPLQC